MEVEREVETVAEVFHERFVRVRLRAPDPVMDVDNGQADTQSRVHRKVSPVKGTEKGDGVCAA